MQQFMNANQLHAGIAFFESFLQKHGGQLSPEQNYSMGGSHLFLRRFGGNEIATHRYKLDRTFFKTYEKKEQLTNFAIKTYKALPDSTRKKLKQVLGKS